MIGGWPRGSLHLFADTAAALREISRVVKPGAILSACTFTPGSGGILRFRAVRQWLRRSQGLHVFGLPEMEHCLGASGFEAFRPGVSGSTLTLTARRKAAAPSPKRVVLRGDKASSSPMALSKDPTGPHPPPGRRGCALPLLVLCCAAQCGAAPVQAAQDGGLPPVIPVGLDCYRQWERWPYQRIGARAYLRSTYDRSGGNEGADASHFLYQLADDLNVALDVEGPGVLYFVRTNHWHGSPWHYGVDGLDHVVSESATADPARPPPDSVFLPPGLFPAPLALTWAQTKGADLVWVPIPFEGSLRLAYGRTHYGTGYFIYDQYVGGAALSQPIRTWDPAAPPGADVLALVSRAGTDIAPRPGTPDGDRAGVREHDSVMASVGAGEAALVRLLRPGRPTQLRAIECSAPRGQAVDLGRARIRITWDDRAFPSVDAPVALFFGAGTLYNRDGREYLVRAFPVAIRYDAERVHLACYFPMPFFQSARIELVGGDRELSDVRWSIRSQPLDAPRSHVGYFHATYVDHAHPVRGRDLVLLDTRAAEGGGDWSGSVVGTSFVFSDRANLTTLEGDPRFFFDDSRSPQVQGTGTEEWGGGGDYWGGENMTLPFAGHPVGARSAAAARCAEDQIESAYRFLLADLMPFGRNAVVGLEHGGLDDSEEHYRTVAFWYGLPGASLVRTDELRIGDEVSERAHRYSSPEASPPYAITSRYELGVDHLPALEGQGAAPVEVFPAHLERARKTAGASEFTLRLEPRNLGVLLRRTLDYALPNQRAEVSVADDDGRAPAWRAAGIWYVAGSSTCVYSNPKGELGAPEHVVQTSNRRFRDDEFLVPRGLTADRSSIRVRVRFTPVATPLFPGHPPGELAWSEIRYDAYCFVMP